MLETKSVFYNYKFYKEINMKIPSKVIYYKYMFINNNFKQATGLEYTLELDLNNVKYIKDESGNDFGLQSSKQKEPLIMDDRIGHKLRYTFTPYVLDSMDTIDKESQRLVKIRDKEKYANVMSYVVKVVSFVVIILILYFVISKLNKNNKFGS